MSTLRSFGPSNGKTTAAPAERRLVPRFPSVRPAQVRPLGEPEGAPTAAGVVNVCYHGLCLFVKLPLERGAPLEVRFPGLRVDPRAARPVQQRRQDDGWLAGCVLDPPLSRAELDALRA